MPTRAVRLMVRLERLSGMRWYPAALGGVSLLDYYAPFLPLNTVLAAAVLPRPERWRSLGLSFAVGAALGAALLAAIIRLVGPEVVSWIGQSRGAPLWMRIEDFVDAYGIIALAALAVSPLPVRIAVVVLALAGTHPFWWEPSSVQDA